jgi:hypothetical protein
LLAVVASVVYVPPANRVALLEALDGGTHILNTY